MRTNSVLHHLFQFLKTCPNKYPTNFEKLHFFLCTLGLCVNVLRLECHVNALLALRAARFVFPHSEKLSEKYSMYSENVLWSYTERRHASNSISQRQSWENYSKVVRLLESGVRILYLSSPSQRATFATLEPFFSVPGFPPASFLLLRPLLAVPHLQLDLPWQCHFIMLINYCT